MSFLLSAELSTDYLKILGERNERSLFSNFAQFLEFYINLTLNHVQNLGIQTSNNM